MRHLSYLGVALSLGGCGEPSISVDPQTGPSSGYYPLSIELADAEVDAAGITALRVGDNRAFDLAVEGSLLRAVVQGSSIPDAADIVLEGAAGTSTFTSAFHYEPAPSDHFRRVCAMGASLSQGVQQGVPSHHGSLMSPPAQVARQLGGYFPLPILVHDFMPQIGPADIGPPPACAVPDVAAFVAASAIQVLKKLNGDFANARIDPDLPIHNFAVGGSKIRDLLRGPDPDNFAGNFLSHLVFDPHGQGPVASSQLELCEALDPSLILVSDLYYNDVAASLLGDDVIDPSLITSHDEFEADLVEILHRLAATGAQVFITNMPRPSILPASFEKKARMIEDARAAAAQAGTDPDEAAATAEAAADEAIDATDAIARTFNESLATHAASHPNLHVVDAEAGVEAAAQDGLEVSGTVLTTQKFGGLLGLDGVHFTDTGYAFFANFFIGSINAELGTQVPSIDLPRVFATDAGTPARLAEAGLDVGACDR